MGPIDFALTSCSDSHRCYGILNEIRCILQSHPSIRVDIFSGKEIAVLMQSLVGLIEIIGAL